MVGGGVIWSGSCLGTEVEEDRLRILVLFYRVVRPSRTSVWHAFAWKNSGLMYLRLKPFPTIARLGFRGSPMFGRQFVI
jgi:hypothetical protein